MSYITRLVNALFNRTTTTTYQEPIPVRQIPSGVSIKLANTDANRIASFRTHGDITAEQVKNLHSDRIRNAICSLGAWIGLAQAFQAYGNIHGSKYPKERDVQRLKQGLATFHGWNEASLNPVSHEDILETVARMTTIRVREDSTTDAILARIKNITIDEVKEERLARAAKQQKQREQLVEAFVQEVASSTSYNEDPSMPAAKALKKAEETLAWIAGWDNPDVGELLIAEADIAILHRMDKEYGGYEDSREIDNQLLSEVDMAAGMNSGR